MLPAIIGGRAGGFPGWVNERFAGGGQSRGIERANIIHEIGPDLGHWSVEIVGKVKAWAKAIIRPTSPPGKYPQLINAPGSETGPTSACHLRQVDDPVGRCALIQIGDDIPVQIGDDIPAGLSHWRD